MCVCFWEVKGEEIVVCGSWEVEGCKWVLRVVVLR